jgi:predicted alpha/beta superfamily hydrolase
MNVHKLVGMSALCLLSASGSFAQAQNLLFEEKERITLASKLSVHSEVLGEDREVLISLPANYETSDKRYPVVYLLDAQYLFEFQHAYGLLNTLAFLETIPQVILVGIASADRDKDLTPPDAGEDGNADQFIAFLRDELQQLIEQQYRTEPYKLLIGHSAGGLFALHTLLHAPDTFDAYIALSPAVWSNDGVFVTGLRDVLSEERELSSSLFTSLANEGGSERELYDEFVKILSERKPQGLSFSHMNFLDEDHGSTLIPGMRSGLEFLYANWAPPDTVNSLSELVAHYRSLSEHFGYAVGVPVTHASDLGFKLLRNGDPESALEIFEYALENVAQDAIAHYQVGVALRRLGRLGEALPAFERAIALGAGTDMYPVFVRSRDGVAQELNEQSEVAGPNVD